MLSLLGDSSNSAVAPFSLYSLLPDLIKWCQNHPFSYQVCNPLSTQSLQPYICSRFLQPSKWQWTDGGYFLRF
ncbi:hypothetical protein MRB53_026773 [Persea americana]|uniref:Uncharacterized protein n=1 Tax=Persea americana TaxID=3435 RepID=A0ACC2LK24_PERAE|nr:hypothetical protein MRB53_026773 [Persea americana]